MADRSTASTDGTSNGDGGSGVDLSRFLERPGDIIGPYKLISPIGEGGFGEVWVAERREPFTQRVALKVIKPGMDSRAVLARFDQERQALAVMNHPNIAKVIDGGMTERGRPYFAMEYVRGEPITVFCDRRKLSIEARLALFAEACDAIHHAHVKGIVHRDIKPSNILAYEQDGKDPTLKVIDFGVAKALTHRLTEATIFTETGQMIGTAEYMSPEQADPSAADIDTRSDVYSLGVLLYELVTRELPFDAKELRRKAYAEIQRTLREVDPPTPSARLAAVAAQSTERAAEFERTRSLPIGDAVRRLRRELEWIPLKAMRKEPAGRYQSAALLAEDVRNYLAGKPLSAAPESMSYRLRKYARRSPLRATVAVVLPLASVLAIGVALEPIYRAYQVSLRSIGMQRYTTLAQDPDPAVVKDPTVRARIKATGKPWKIRHDATGIVLLLVPPGEFVRGSPLDEVGRWQGGGEDREAQHPRTIERAFYLSEREVSQREWLQLMPENPAFFERAPDGRALIDHPVECLSWHACQAFCAESRGFFRLPTEDEWEYACRAGTTTPFSFGSGITAAEVNFDGGRPYHGAPKDLSRQATVPCGSLPPNPWGFYEMHGNVNEWVADKAVELGSDSKAPRIIRGGSFSSPADYCRSAMRHYNVAPAVSGDQGFRVARTCD